MAANDSVVIHHQSSTQYVVDMGQAIERKANNRINPVPPRYSSRQTPHISIRRPSPYATSPSPIPSYQRPPRRRRIFLLLLILIIFIFTIRNLSTLRSLIPFLPNRKSFTEPHPLRTDLNLTISQVSTSPPVIRITATNFHPTTSLTLLTWSTPFDADVFATNAIAIVDPASGQNLIPLKDAVRHSLPPTRDDVVELGPRRAVTKDVQLVSPEWVLERGRMYDVQCRGRWKVVWHASVSDVGERALKVGAGPTGVVEWEFESEVVRVRVD